jgi:hypothetical protein
MTDGMIEQNQKRIYDKLENENQVIKDADGNIIDTTLYPQYLDMMGNVIHLNKLRRIKLSENELNIPVFPFDNINHPKHYTDHPSGVECIQITEHMNFCLGNAMKYIWRAGLKNDKIEDLKKAKWYLDREIKRLEKE